jgi:Bacterial cadherin-like domain
VRIKDIETSTGLDLLSNLPDPIERALEEKGRYTGSSDANFFPLPTSVFAPLLAGTDSGEANNLSSIGQYGIRENRAFNTVIFNSIGKFDPRLTQINIGQVGSLKQWSDTQNCSIQSSSSEVGITQWAFSQIGKTEIGTNQDGFNQNSLRYDGMTEVSSTQISTFQPSTPQISSTQISTTQISPIQLSSKEDSTTQIDIRQLGIIQPSRVNFNPTEISLPSSITLQQLLSSHNPNLQNTTVPTWTEFLQSPTPFNLKIEIQDLPTGQLAEATITGYDTNNRPNSGTLTLDTDGNSLGWFIDTTPEDNSEFTTQLADTAFRATTGAASGKYDLLTTILHELGHLQGIISGNTAFDTHVQNINGIPTFIDGGLTATLTPDGSHLDSTLYPYDLMNTSLKPGVRKLPSSLDLAILNTIWSNKPTTSQQLSTTANLTAGALIGITNGDFTTPTTWNTEGATNIINGTATLTEQSQKLSELTQAFIIPQGAKTLQFTIKDNHLVPGDTTKTANDAFEVALLDTNTFTPLAGTSIGLNHTDSLLNIQANGTIHKSDKVTITALTNNSSIVTIDLTQITPTTQATLYFNLLGFGARTSTVTIDDVKLFTDTQPIPVTKNDTLTLDQNTPLTLDPTQLTTNDTNVSQIQIINQPTHGTLTQTPDGKLTYQPNPTPSTSGMTASLTSASVATDKSPTSPPSTSPSTTSHPQLKP